MSSTTVTRGNSHETFYIQPSITPAAVLTAITATQTFALPGLQTNDIIKVFGFNGAQTLGIIIGEADCFNANVLSVQFGNITGGTLTPQAGVYNIQITRLEGPAPATAV